MIIIGDRHEDDRGIITYNNTFDLSEIKRIYTLENHSIDFVRGWQGHAIEQRWFAAVQGRFEIMTKKVSDFKQPIDDLPTNFYELTDYNLTFLHIPPGHITAIKAVIENSKLLVLADYALGEVDDEYRFEFK